MLVASPGGAAPDCLAPLPSAPEDCLGHFQSMHFHGLVGSRYQFGGHDSPVLDLTRPHSRRDTCWHVVSEAAGRHRCSSRGLAVIPVKEEQGEGAHHKEEQDPHSEAGVVFDGLVGGAQVSEALGAYPSMYTSMNILDRWLK